MKSPVLDSALLDKYLANECGSEERATVEEWLHRDPDAHSIVGALRRLDRKPGTPESLADERAAEQRLRAAIHRRALGRASHASSAFVNTKNPRPGNYLGQPLPTWTKQVVGALALLTIVLIARWSDVRGDKAQPVLHYATGHGELSRVALPDGSRITLASDSRLSYAVDSHGARTVTLAGQAHFAVTHDPRRPFTVRTGAVHTQVLGTTFDIRRYDSDSVVRVIVVDGKVASRGRSGTGAPVLLVAGTGAQMTDSTAVIVTNQNTDETEAWTYGNLVFDETPVPDMLHTLERWYGYEFRLADSALVGRHVTAMFSIGDTASTLTRLKTLLNVTLHFEGNVVTLSPVRRSQKVDRPLLRRSPSVFPSQSEVGK